MTTEYSSMNALDSYMRTRQRRDELLQKGADDFKNLISKRITECENEGLFRLTLNITELKNEFKVLHTFKSIIPTIFKEFKKQGYKICLLGSQNNTSVGNLCGHEMIEILWFRPEGWEYIPGGDKFKEAEDKIAELINT